MRKIKKFLVGLLFYAPFGANAIPPFLIAALVALGGGALSIIGVSAYRTIAPVNMTESLGILFQLLDMPYIFWITF